MSKRIEIHLFRACCHLSRRKLEQPEQEEQREPKKMIEQKKPKKQRSKYV